MNRPLLPDGDDLTVEVRSVSAQPLPGNQFRLAIQTSRGDIPGILHPHEGGEAAVVLVGGAIGGFDGPANAIYPALSDALLEERVTSLRLSYRLPNDLHECVIDTLAAVSVLKGIGAWRVALVGHSFGGAVVIMAGSMTPLVTAGAALSSQTFGATGASLISPRPLLLVHGAEDTRLPPRCSQQIYEWARDPKELVIMPGAGHGLRECREELFTLLRRWLVDKLQ